MVTLKTLYSSTLTATTTSGSSPVRLDAGASTSAAWLVKGLSLYSVRANTQPITIDLYVKQAGSGSPSTYIYKGYSIGVNAQLLVEKEITLNHVGSADELWLKFTAASGSQTLDCVISGIERSQ